MSCAALGCLTNLSFSTQLHVLHLGAMRYVADAFSSGSGSGYMMDENLKWAAVNGQVLQLESNRLR